jgi:pimeloyl-ACP methyl ester carboxylesterase
MNESTWNRVCAAGFRYLVVCSTLAGCSDGTPSADALAPSQGCPAIEPAPHGGSSESPARAGAPACTPCEMGSDAARGNSAAMNAMGSAGRTPAAAASSEAGDGGPMTTPATVPTAGANSPAASGPAPDALSPDQLLEECGVAPDGLAPQMVSIESSTTPDVRLSMAVQGDPAQPPLVLVHGFPDFWCGWARVIPQLSKRYYVVAPDMRGYNRSSKPGDPNNPQDLAPYAMKELIQDMVDIVHFAASQTQQKVSVVAHDWGAIVAWPYASLFPADLSRLMAISVSHPEAMAQFMTSGDPALAQAQSAQLQALTYVSELVMNDSPARYSADDYKLLLDSLDQKHLQDPNSFPEVERAAYKRMWSADDQASFKSQIKYYRANFGTSAQPQMSGMLTPVPTTFIAPIHDGAILYPHSMDFLREHVDAAQPVVIRPIDAGHFPQREKAAVLVKMIEQFMDAQWDTL